MTKEEIEKGNRLLSEINTMEAFLKEKWSASQSDQLNDMRIAGNGNIYYTTETSSSNYAGSTVNVSILEGDKEYSTLLKAFYLTTRSHVQDKINRLNREFDQLGKD